MTMKSKIGQLVDLKQRGSILIPRSLKVLKKPGLLRVNAIDIMLLVNFRVVVGNMF